MNPTHSTSLVHQESRDVRGRPLAFALIVTVIIGTAAVGVERFILDENREPVAEVPRRPIAPTSLTSPIEQTRIDLTERGIDKRVAATRRLENWGWVDRKQGIVHVPIDDAIESMLAEQRNGGKDEKKPP